MEGAERPVDVRIAPTGAERRTLVRIINNIIICKNYHKSEEDKLKIIQGTAKE